MPLNRTSFLFVLLFLIAPLYVWRFTISLGGYNLPTNFLMVVSFVVIAICLISVLWQGEGRKLLSSLKSLPKSVLIGVFLIGIASLISLVLYGVTAEKIAQWVVLYLQPMMVFGLLHFYVSSDEAISKKFIAQFRLAAYVFLFFAGSLAILQYFTLWALPADWQGNMVEPKRAIAFFAHPNAFALFITPLLAWLLPDMGQRILTLWSILDSSKSWMQQAGVIIRQRFVILAWLVGAFGLLLSLSRGAWLGLLVACAVYALLSANKKVIVTFVGCAILLAGIVFAVPNLRWRVLLPFHGEKSSLARVSLWDTGSKMIHDSPIFGKGISGFANNWYAYNNDPNLDHYNFPHNILLNFWIDLGLLGVAGFAVIIGWSIWQGILRRRNPVALALLLFMVALVVHGLIDIPYLKNDLAMVFWMVLALSTAQATS